MFAPLGLVPGITLPKVEAAIRRGGWGAAAVSREFPVDNPG